APLADLGRSSERDPDDGDLGSDVGAVLLPALVEPGVAVPAVPADKVAQPVVEIGSAGGAEVRAAKLGVDLTLLTVDVRVGVAGHAVADPAVVDLADAGAVLAVGDGFDLGDGALIVALGGPDPVLALGEHARVVSRVLEPVDLARGVLELALLLVHEGLLPGQDREARGLELALRDPQGTELVEQGAAERLVV